MLYKTTLTNLKHLLIISHRFNRPQFSRPTNLIQTTPILYNFSTIKKTQQSLHTPVGKVIDWMDKLKDKNISEGQLEQAYQSIHQSIFSQSQKISLTKYLMSIMYKNNMSTQQLLNSPGVKKIQQGKVFIQMETLMFIISREVTSEKPDFNLVNNLYLECFNKLLPSVTGIEKTKCEVLLFKNFGKYMIDQGVKQKGIPALEKSISAHKQLITEQYNRMQHLINVTTVNSQENKKKTKAEKQRQTFQINALKENIRRLIESMLQVLHFYYNAQKAQMKSSTAQQRQETIVTICTLINESMKAAALIPGVQNYSRHYHRLKQIYLELQYTYAVTTKNPEKVKQIRKYMKDFIQSCLNDIYESRQHLQVQKQIVLAILSLRLHLSRIETGNNFDRIKNDLSQCGLKIIQKGQMDQHKITKEVVTKLLSDFIKKNVR